MATAGCSFSKSNKQTNYDLQYIHSCIRNGNLVCQEATGHEVTSKYSRGGPRYLLGPARSIKYCNVEYIHSLNPHLLPQWEHAANWEVNLFDIRNEAPSRRRESFFKMQDR